MPKQTKPNDLSRKIISAVIFLFLLQGSFAQSKYGIIAGAGKSALYKFPFSPEDYNRYSSSTALWAGLTGDFSLTNSGVGVYTTAVYNNKGFKYQMINETGNINTVKDSSYSQKLNYADVNIYLRKKFTFGENNSFFAGTGPAISFLTGGKEIINSNYFGTAVLPLNNSNSKLSEPRFKKSFISLGFAAGFQVNNFSIYFNANIPLGDYYNDVQKEVKHKTKTFGLNLGYTLLQHVKNEEKKIKEKKSKEKEIAYIPVVIDSLGDTDADGIANKDDKCPGHKGVIKYNGCPVPDTDGDGVNDDNDKCIAVGGPVTNNGCPLFSDTLKKASKDTSCYLVYFEPAKSILRSEAYSILTKVIQQLKANPKLVAIFKGHTDNAGNQEANNSRSLSRASVCADYVASFYISRNRLSILSLGNTQPVADLTDPLLQWKNRRVEICVFEKQ